MISIIRSRTVVFAIAAVVALAIGSAAVVFAATFRSGGKVTAVRTATATDYPQTGALDGYVDVSGMSVSMPVPSSTRALLIVTFSGESRCLGDSAKCFVRVLVNGIPAQPGDVEFDSGQDAADFDPAFNWESNSMQFVYGPIAAGTYTVKVQYKVQPAGSFMLGYRTLTVLRSRV